MKLLHDFDLHAKCLEVQMNSNLIKWKIIAVTLTFLSANLVSTCLSIMRFHRLEANVDLPIGFGFLLHYFILWINQFSFAALALKMRFELLNKNLKFSFNSGKINFIASINLHSHHNSKNLIKIICELYSQLCDGIDIVNDAFTLQLIPFASYYLPANLFTSYGVIREIILGSGLSMWSYLNLGWLLFSTSLISFALYSSESTLKIARKIPIIFSAILKREKCKFLEDEFKTFFFEVQCRSFTFQNELFRIEWKLLLSVRK